MSLPTNFFIGRGGPSIEPLDVTTVFSAQTYSGTGGARTLNTTYPLNAYADGGMILSKSRTAASYTNHYINDTARGITKVLFTDNTNNQSTYPNAISNIWNGSYTMSDITYNQSGHDYYSYVFKRNERFFDVITFTGNGSSQTISHSLNQEVGMIWVKRTDQGDGWAVYHRYLGATSEMFLDRAGTATASVNTWNNTAPTETTFTVGPQNHVNASGGQYVAYIFAHEPRTGAIACGGFSSGTTSVNLGFQPQALLLKSTTDTNSYTGSWRLTDTARGGLQIGDDPYTMMDNANAEQTSSFGNMANATATGFDVSSQGDYGSSTIYMAIKAP